MENLNGMATFFIAIALMVFVTVVVLVWPLMRAKSPDSADRQAVNLAIAKQRLRELTRELENGTLGDDAYAQAKAELELSLAGDLDDSETPSTKAGGRWMAAVVLVLVPVLAGWLYFRLGSPLFLDEQSMAQAAAQSSGAGEEMSPEIAELVSKLEQRMKDVPDDPDGQRLLIRTYMAQQRFAEAVTALDGWGARDSGNPDLLVMLADASAAQAGGRLIGGPTELLESALQLNPNHRQALWIMGYAQSQNNNAAEAIAFWQRLLPLVTDDANAKQQVSNMIADMQQQAGLAPTAPSVASDSTASASGGAGLQLVVSLDPSIADKVSPDDAVFVYAKTPTGPPMPLAVVRVRVADLPLTVTLDDSTAMIPTHILSGQSSVTVGARVSLGGGPVAQPGDYYIELENVGTPSASVVELAISQLK